MRRNQTNIAESGIGVALIGMGTPEQARAFRAEFDLPFTLLCDPAKLSYQSYGLLRLNPLREARRDTVERYLADARRYGAQTLTPGQDVLQLGGLFLIDTCGVIRWQHLALRIADYPAIADILALPEIAGRPSP